MKRGKGKGVCFRDLSPPGQSYGCKIGKGSQIGGANLLRVSKMLMIFFLFGSFVLIFGDFRS